MTPAKSVAETYAYAGDPQVVLAHAIEVGDGTGAATPAAIAARPTTGGVEVTVAGSRFLFESRPPFKIVPVVGRGEVSARRVLTTARHRKSPIHARPSI